MEATPNWLDLALLALLAFFCLKAMFRGFIREISSLAGMIVAVVAAVASYRQVGDFLRRVSAIEAGWWEAAAFAAVLLAVLGVFLWVGSGLSRLLHAGPLGIVDRLAGAVVGLAKGVLVSYLLVNLLLLITPLAQLGNPDPDRANPLKQSLVAPHVVQGGRYLLSLLPENLTQDLQQRAGLIKPTPPSSPTPAPTPPPLHRGR